MKNPPVNTPSPAAAYGASVRPAWDWRRAVSPTGNTGDAIFRALLLSSAVLLIIIVVAMIAAMASSSLLSLQNFGSGF
ncbi:MAG: hypothetical protein WKF30_03940 [Pyrinomonadaceae bacterium]